MTTSNAKSGPKATSPKVTLTAGGDDAPSTSDASLLTTGTVPTVTDAQTKALESACTTFGMALGTSGTLLTKGDILRLPKPRKNASTFVNTAVMVATRYNISSPSYPTANITANQALADNLIGAIDAVETLLKMLKDTSLLAQSSAWKGASVLYQMLKAEAPANPSIETSIEPLRAQLRPQLLTPAGTKTVKRSRSASAIAKKAKAAPGAAATVTATTNAASSPAAAISVGHS